MSEPTNTIHLLLGKRPNYLGIGVDKVDLPPVSISGLIQR